MHEELLDESDDSLLTELADLYSTLDPMPSGLTDDVRFSITVEALHAQIAELVSTPPLAVRGDDSQELPETITFTRGNVSLMVSIDDSDPELRTIDGWLTVGDAHVEVHVGEEVHEVTADAGGRFVVEGIRRGRTWFVVRREGSDDPPIVTPPISL